MLELLNLPQIDECDDVEKGYIMIRNLQGISMAQLEDFYSQAIRKVFEDSEFIHCLDSKQKAE